MIYKNSQFFVNAVKPINLIADYIIIKKHVILQLYKPQKMHNQRASKFKNARKFELLNLTYSEQIFGGSTGSLKRFRNFNTCTECFPLKEIVDITLDAMSQRLNEKRGTLILFPSYLYHSVTECKTERISVAFNFFNDV